MKELDVLIEQVKTWKERETAAHTTRRTTWRAVHDRVTRLLTVFGVEERLGSPFHVTDTEIRFFNMIYRESVLRDQGELIAHEDRIGGAVGDSSPDQCLDWICQALGEYLAQGS